ncbi:MAG: CPBP family intramembrane metalloprotease [Acidobacteriota bacterium]|nr:CPBP family intramembrane metalloprotease [Acidobacteriota bacterium]
MRPFLATLAGVWVAAAGAAYFYSRQEHIPWTLALTVLPAFLVEIAFYLAPGFEGARKAFDRLGNVWIRCTLLAVSAVIPYLLATLRTDSFSILSLAELAFAATVIAFWYAEGKRSLAADLLLLAIAALVFASGFFGHVYPKLAPRLPLDILGKLMWIRLGIMAVLSIRGLDDAHFGFIPDRRDWRVGVEQYVMFLPVGAALAYFTGFARLHPLAEVWWRFPVKAAGLFLGILWVVALGEEFFFRAFLQRELARKFGNIAGLAAASLLFGAAHLWFRGFPNWRFALVAAAAGVFYGIALMRSGSVRAGMVTHALVVTTWRVLFSG